MNITRSQITRLLWAFLFVAALIVGGELKPQPQAISDRDKVRLREAQLHQQEVLTQLLQSPLYASFQAAQTTTAHVVADIEKTAGCKLDAVKAECEPPKEASKPKP